MLSQFESRIRPLLEQADSTQRSAIAPLRRLYRVK